MKLLSIILPSYNEELMISKAAHGSVKDFSQIQFWPLGKQ